MPRYVYKCDNCTVSFQIVHSIKERLTDCEEGGVEGGLKRIPSMPVVLTKKENNQKIKTGTLVKEYIEDAKEDLKQEKEELLNQEHKDG